MLPGVELLNEIVVEVSYGWPLLVLIFGIIIVFAIGLGCDSGFGVCFGFIMFIIGVIFAATDILPPKETYTKYDVIVDDSVSLVDFYEKYEVIDINGKIYTVKEKED